MSSGWPDRERRLRLHHARAAHTRRRVEHRARPELAVVRGPRRTATKALKARMTTTPEAEPLSRRRPSRRSGKYGYGWSDSDAAGASAQRVSPRRWCGISRRRTSRVDARRTAQGAAHVRQKADAELGVEPRRHRFLTTSSTSCGPPKRATSWEELPEDIKTLTDRLGIPEAEAKIGCRRSGSVRMPGW